MLRICLVHYALRGYGKINIVITGFWLFQWTAMKKFQKIMDLERISNAIVQMHAGK